MKSILILFLIYNSTLAGEKPTLSQNYPNPF